VTPHLRPPPPSTAAAQPFSSPPPVGSSVGRRRLVCCTVIARNYLAQARVLAASFLEHEPEGIFYLLVVDGLPTGVAPPRNVRLMTAGDLGLGDLVTWRFKFGVAELCTAVKAALLSALVARHRDDDVVFLDPDILVLGRMEALRQHFERSAIVLTPHITRPIELDGRYPSEADLLATGVHNLGFIGVRWSDDALAFLRWWDERLRHACRFDFSAGYFVDQKWVDLAPVFFPSVSVLRDDTYNVAYWNLNSRRLSRRETGFLVNDRPITFFHFSGLDHVRGRFRDSRQNRIDVGAETALGELVAYYVRRLEDSGFAECSAWEYPYARFSNGAPIPAVMRALFSDLESEQRQRFADPFRAEGEASFLSWAVTPDPERGNLSPFAEKVYRLRPDVMRAYPDVQGRDRDGFLQWAVTYGAREMGYDPAIILQQTHPE
jgi:hypothetical protein